MSSIEQKRGLIVVKRRLDEIDTNPDKAQAVNVFATEMAERDSRIRGGFAAIFKSAGHWSFGPHDRGNDITETDHINLGAEEASGALSVRLAVKLPDPDGVLPAFKAVDMRFYNDDEHLDTERYATTTTVNMIDIVAAGGDYYKVSHGFSTIAGAHYEGFKDDFYELEKIMFTAEYWQARIWQALGDVGLNPEAARSLNQQT